MDVHLVLDVDAISGGPATVPYCGRSLQTSRICRTACCAHLNSHTSTCIPRAYACLLYPSCPQHCCLSFCPAHLLSPSLDAHTATRAALQHGCVVLHVNAHTACVSTVIRPSISTFLSSSRLPCAIPSLSSLLSRVLTHASGGRGCPAHRTQLVLLVS